MPAIIAAASSPDAPPLRSTIATSASANKVNRSTSVDIAAIDGRRTLRSELKTYTGHGEASAVETNDEMIVLSRLRLNASNPPASTAGIIRGRVIFRNVSAGDA